MLLVACGDDDTGTADPATSSGGEALASAIRIDDTVDARVGAAGFVAVGEPVDVAVGDTVRTDSTGFAEVAYFDGSHTRLDTDTEFEVIDLVDDAGTSTVRTRMGVGRTWHRVTDLAGDDSYVVETAVATATVRGTAFSITCAPAPEPDTCSFTVHEGTVEVTPDASGDSVSLDAGEQLTITADGDDPSPRTVDLDQITDGWIARNLDLDTDAGFSPPGSDGDDGEVAVPGSGDAECVMNGSVGGGWATTFVDEPVQRVPVRDWDTNEQTGWSYTNETADNAGPDATAVTLSMSPTSVFLNGPSGNIGLSVNDGGTYDFAADGTGAHVVDTRPPTPPEIPEASVDLTVECEEAVTPVG